MSKVNDDLVFVAAKRTPFGTFGGSLSKVSATDLAVQASQACLDQASLKGEDIDAVVMGNVAQSSSDAIYLARHVGLKVGLPIDRPALIVNRLCGSGFEAIAQGAYLIEMEGMQAVLVGGTESMTQIPYVLRQARFGYRLGHGQMEDYLTAALTDSYTGMPMAITAENLAEKYQISRAEVDAFALMSQQRASQAWERGDFSKEVISMSVGSAKAPKVFNKDEHIRPETTLEGLAKLSPLFKEKGTVTAGTASGICDGAASLILCKRSFAEKKGLTVLGKLSSWAAVGCDPKIMGIGPVPATHKALDKWSQKSGSSKTLAQIDLVEVNEAFGAQFLAVQKDLKLDIAKTNTCGGAIAIGHPLAASGARLVAHLLYKLERENKKTALATACIGGGQGMSVIVER
jgi:acetyl-CoA C-acetyltransferase/acetyl-CoA acyltransferase 2